MTNRFLSKSPDGLIYQTWQYFKGLDGLRNFLCEDGADPNRSHCLEENKR